MPLRTCDVVPISEARARLTELAEKVVGAGAEKVLTKNGSSFVAIVDAHKQDYQLCANTSQTATSFCMSTRKSK